MLRSQSAGALGGRSRQAPAPCWMGSEHSGNTGNGGFPLTEVAVLYFHDGAVRTMTSQEAVAQMSGVSKLPKEFWQHIRMLQAPVVSSSGGCAPSSKYITYGFDSRSGGCDPQAPLPRADHNRHGQSTSHELGDEGSRVAAVPRQISATLAGRRKGEVGAGIELMSGQSEFVQEEADGPLWLVNASRLCCVRSLPSEDAEERSPSEEEEIRYFQEGEFVKILGEHEGCWSASGCISSEGVPARQLQLL